MKRVVLTVTLAATLISGAACSKDNDQSSSAADKSPSFTIGIKYDQPGMSVMGADGKPRGFDVDTAAYIANNLGVQPDHITWKEARTEQREDMLSSGAVDFVVASYSISAARQKQVSFAGPYLMTGQDLLVRQGETGIDRPEALGGRSVCSAKGSTSADKIKKDFAADVNLTARDTYSQCVDDLLAGTVDAVSTDGVILAGYAATHPDQLRVVGHPFTKERYGVGVKKGNIDLQTRITGAIQAMIADGSWQRSVDANLKRGGYQPLPAPPVFNAPDAPIAAGDSTKLDPNLVKTGNDMITMVNAKDWTSLAAVSCPEAQETLRGNVAQLVPQNDTNLGPEVKDVSYDATSTGLSQTSPDSATLLAHITYTNVPDKYKQYFKDIDFTNTLSRRDGTWMLCAVNADFVES
ncbi:glutamate ABC transporter substrate-binding protein [Nocardia sp. NBC_01499]|uniref:glutamate ABC transporter substrate-binding protein n=1 Tax=Nocardia sp. NBC_01499 TaxID=2903597 RepID=UPI003866E15B